jgi:hypothetical protein
MDDAGVLSLTLEFVLEAPEGDGESELLNDSVKKSFSFLPLSDTIVDDEPDAECGADLGMEPEAGADIGALGSICCCVLSLFKF